MSSDAGPGVRVLCFDVYGTLVDPLAIQRQLEEYVGGETAAGITAVWRQKQLEYTFRVTAMEWYRDFAWVTRQALAFALGSVGVELAPEHVESVLARYLELEVFPDVADGLERLADAGRRLAVLSNGTPGWLEGILHSAGLGGRFEAVVSVDEVKAFKPAPRVYHHAAARLGVPIAELMLVSSNPFDVIGARHAGTQAAWIRRGAALFDDFGFEPTLVVGGLPELADRLQAGGSGV